ncbi:hypothetical protein NC653_028854 [Populus alba x Populus x berolinensis]|uniref:Uncharacterized protein n=1 Tax=Populus alba x Populus x berolinensis TaxID=444605 RepID=A0AAD6M0P0_9ROSI|nr:hypothetical protein NC653_028854 [Populus alba x Populus x berolinensis]
MRNQAGLEDQFSSLTTHAGPKRLAVTKA